MDFWIDIIILILAGAIGGLIGGSLVFVLCRTSGATRTTLPRPRFYIAPTRKAKIIKFPPKTIKFPTRN